jgi:cell division septation protein DedD
LYQQGYQAQIIRQGDFYSVQVGDFDNLDDAANLENALRMLRYDTLLIAV